MSLFRAALALLAFVAAGPALGQDRVVTPLMEGWRFLDGSAPISAADPGHDDRSWKPVSLPHTWNALGEYGLERTARTRNRQGEGWYRLTIDGAKLPRRMRHYLQFDGVGSIADVWINGRHVGRHAGAWSRFRIDVTEALRTRGVNVIAVRADNSKPEPGSPTQDVIPLQGDFFIHGGLYRPVSLISTYGTHIDLLDHGGPGVYVRTASLDDAEARIAVRTRISWERPFPGYRPRNRWIPTPVDVVTRLFDGQGREVARSALRATRDASVEPVLALPRPRRWDGRRDPYLYTAVVELRQKDFVLDRVTQRFGVRDFRVDANQGFFLNGRHLPLHGVSRHQDWLERGWALTRADHERDMALIAEMGANTIRMAHYQHAEDWFDLSDETGMIVWAELPFVNKVAFGDAPASPALIANARQQMTELIRQNYNHPSVVTWGIGNEVDIDLAFNRLGPKADARPLLDELDALVKAEDPTRPTVIADCCEGTPGKKADYLAVLTGHADLMGYNRYFGWYYGAADDLGPHLDMLHARHPAVPVSVSEYGAGGALSQHSDNPEGGPINAGGRPHPEEYQSWFHERSWPQLAARRFVWASWIWNMFDFSSVVRQEGDAIDINDKGLVSFDRAVKKDAFFYYKAQWRDDVPVLHITGRRYVDRAYPVTDIRVYSNLETVTLTLDGTSAGRTACPGRICVFRQIALRAGANRIEVRGMRDGKPVSDAVTWNAPDAREGLTINVGDLMGFVAADGRRVGSDNWFEGGHASRIGGEEAALLGGAGDPRLRTGLREGRFRYAIPLPNGRWRVTLLTVETEEPRALRSFAVRAEGATVATITPERLGGGRWKGGETSFDVTVSDGVLDLDFGPNATLSAIDIRPLR